MCIRDSINAEYGNDVLKSIIEGCCGVVLGGTVDLNVPKICFIILGKMVEQWSGTLGGFNQFIYSQIVPASFTLVLKPEFELNDAGAYQVLVEIAKLHKAIFKKCGNEFIEVLKNFLASSFPGYPLELYQAFLQNVVEAQLAAFQSFLRGFVTRVRAGPS
eukprot:TRINITY_DN16498_c0_g1_i1.p1 TRINITY_DN16498_c0_g1~~TRINITY_DN16498_c0_g1_i1.p1  ORF type:complete len:160 (+),score=18.88 TRINITY_DN16498_c0_g1_i1:25-504(+)